MMWIDFVINDEKTRS